MAAQPALAQSLLSVVPDVQMQKEIENTLDAPKRISDAIEDLKKKQTDAQAELAQALARDLAVAPLNIDSSVEKQQAWKVKNDALHDPKVQ
jgi:hypothetical protein